MPGGISNPALGYAAFCAVKLGGYSLAARFISRAYEKKERSAWLIGASRTAIGMAAGALNYGAVLLVSDLIPRAGGFLYLAGLLPVRIGEWWLLLWLFYDRPMNQKKKDWLVVCLATLWSYLLDIPAVAGWMITGGFWVC